MNRFIFSLALIACPLLTFAGTNVGVSVNLGQPGFYGQLELGNLPPPPVIYTQPLTIQHGPIGVTLPPLYLRVPGSHSRNWRHYCGRYNACGRPVYFVQDNWYRHTYAPRYRQDHPYAHERRGEERHDNRHGDHEDRRDTRNEDKREDHYDNRR